MATNHTTFIFLKSAPICSNRAVSFMCTILYMGNTYLAKENFGEFGELWVIHKNFLVNFHRHTEMDLAYELTVVYSQLFLTNSFYLYCSPKFSPIKCSHVWYCMA